MAYCSNCGNPLAEGAAFCGKCGTRLGGVATPSMSGGVVSPVGGGAPSSTPANMKKIVAIAIATALLVGGGLWLRDRLAEDKEWERLKEDLSENERWGQDLGDIHNRGYAYYGNGDYAEAVKYFRQAADKGFALSQLALGQCYTEGHGVAQDFAMATEWYRKAAAQGNMNAVNSLRVAASQGYQPAIDALRGLGY